jgi:hypothetical protein
MPTGPASRRLAISGPKGRFECPWQVFSQLRDNVQHHLEGGYPRGDFGTLHSIADLVDTPATATVEANRLRDEIRAAWRGLSDKPGTDVAVSLRTMAVLHEEQALPAVRGTVLARVSGWPVPVPPQEAQSLGQMFRGVVLELLRITANASDEDCVQVLADTHSRAKRASSPRHSLSGATE